MSGSELRLLHDHLGVPARTQMLSDLIASIAYDHGYRLWRQRIGCLEPIVDQTAAGQPVKHLGPQGLHPRSLAGGKDDDVYDPFCGSGTTLIACEQLTRRCFAMEIEPAYVQVAIDRWEAFTNQKAVQLTDETPAAVPVKKGKRRAS